MGLTGGNGNGDELLRAFHIPRLFLLVSFSFVPPCLPCWDTLSCYKPEEVRLHHEVKVSQNKHLLNVLFSSILSPWKWLIDNSFSMEQNLSKSPFRIWTQVFVLAHQELSSNHSCQSRFSNSKMLGDYANLVEAGYLSHEKFSGWLGSGPYKPSWDSTLWAIFLAQFKVLICGLCLIWDLLYKAKNGACPLGSPLLIMT